MTGFDEFEFSMFFNPLRPQMLASNFHITPHTFFPIFKTRPYFVIRHMYLIRQLLLSGLLVGRVPVEKECT